MKIGSVTNKNELALPWENQREQDFLEKKGKKVLFSYLDWSMQNDLSGSSFRLNISYEFTSYYYSGRDRAGMEKKDKNDPTAMNTICRDWISGFPLAKAGAWKRLFRKLYPDREMVDTLFGGKLDQASAGDHRSENDGLNKGLLKFRHAIIDHLPNGQTGRYMITPRKPAHGIADVPIDYEVVPPKASCTLTIDYTPRECNASAAKTICHDLVQTAIKANEGAIGAKTSSGSFGKIYCLEVTINPGAALSITVSDIPRGKDHKITICPKTIKA